MAEKTVALYNFYNCVYKKRTVCFCRETI